MVECSRWDWRLIFPTSWFSSVLWRCSYGHPACKNRPEITHKVPSARLSRCSLIPICAEHLLRLSSSHNRWSIGRQGFSTDSDHWPLCEHHFIFHLVWIFLECLSPGLTWTSSSLASVRCPLHSPLAGLPDGSRSICGEHGLAWMNVQWRYLANSSFHCKFCHTFSALVRCCTSTVCVRVAVCDIVSLTRCRGRENLLWLCMRVCRDKQHRIPQIARVYFVLYLHDRV